MAQNINNINTEGTDALAALGIDTSTDALEGLQASAAEVAKASADAETTDKFGDKEPKAKKPEVKLNAVGNDITKKLKASTMSVQKLNTTQANNVALNKLRELKTKATKIVGYITSYDDRVDFRKKSVTVKENDQEITKVGVVLQDVAPSAVKCYLIAEPTNAMKYNNKSDIAIETLSDMRIEGKTITRHTKQSLSQFIFDNLSKYINEDETFFEPFTIKYNRKVGDTHQTYSVTYAATAAQTIEDMKAKYADADVREYLTRQIEKRYKRTNGAAGIAIGASFVGVTVKKDSDKETIRQLKSSDIREGAESTITSANTRTDLKLTMYTTTRPRLVGKENYIPAAKFDKIALSELSAADGIKNTAAYLYKILTSPNYTHEDISKGGSTTAATIPGSGITSIATSQFGDLASFVHGADDSFVAAPFKDGGNSAWWNEHATNVLDYYTKKPIPLGELRLVSKTVVDKNNTKGEQVTRVVTGRKALTEAEFEDIVKNNPHFAVLREHVYSSNDVNNSFKFEDVAASVRTRSSSGTKTSANTSRDITEDSLNLTLEQIMAAMPGTHITGNAKFGDK